MRKNPFTVGDFALIKSKVVKRISGVAEIPTFPYCTIMAVRGNHVQIMSGSSAGWIHYTHLTYLSALEQLAFQGE